MEGAQLEGEGCQQKGEGKRGGFGEKGGPLVRFFQSMAKKVTGGRGRGTAEGSKESTKAGKKKGTEGTVSKVVTLA